MQTVPVTRHRFKMSAVISHHILKVCQLIFTAVDSLSDQLIITLMTIPAVSRSSQLVSDQQIFALLSVQAIS